ncbi:unnamed protein product [Prorocentrum cordatum]|uniref:Uncharacterized protein n=1 Tax=Prorocentrum cordatum TaxID=2364126 RepID=A0ABN9WZ57_9DINO|nr:unnamed protein product [Polarella glacialis]
MRPGWEGRHLHSPISICGEPRLDAVLRRRGRMTLPRSPPRERRTHPRQRHRELHTQGAIPWMRHHVNLCRTGQRSGGPAREAAESDMQFPRVLELFRGRTGPRQGKPGSVKLSRIWILQDPARSGALADHVYIDPRLSRLDVGSTRSSPLATSSLLAQARPRRPQRVSAGPASWGAWGRAAPPRPRPKRGAPETVSVRAGSADIPACTGGAEMRMRQRSALCGGQVRAPPRRSSRPWS